MIQLYAELNKIDYDVLISSIQVPIDNRKPVPGWLIKLLGKLLASHLSGLLRLVIPKKEIQEFVEEFGVYFSKIELKGIPLIEEVTNRKNILKISIHIKSVDWAVLADSLSGIAQSGENAGTNSQADSSSNADSNNTANQVQQAAEIVKPFISDTMATIPLSAIVKLFDLLWKDKVIEFAKNCGVVVSEVSVEP